MNLVLIFVQNGVLHILKLTVAVQIGTVKFNVHVDMSLVYMGGHHKLMPPLRGTHIGGHQFAVPGLFRILVIVMALRHGLEPRPAGHGFPGQQIGNRHLLCLPSALLAALYPYQGRQKLVIVLPVFCRRRIAADERHLCYKRRVSLYDGLLHPFHPRKASLVVVQAQADLVHRRVIPEELQERIGRGAAKGEVVAVLPRATDPFLQRRQGEGVDGALGHRQRTKSPGGRAP